MTTDCSAFLRRSLEKIARRYALRGQLTGVMKLGTSLGHEQLRELHDFFGLDPIRTNAREEVRIHFDRLLKSMPEAAWLDRIGSQLGYRVEPMDLQRPSPAVATLISRLKLAYPDLEPLTETLAEAGEALRRLGRTHSEEQLTKRCFQMAEAVRFLLANSSPVTVSEIGARYFGDSKLLRQGELRDLLLDWLHVFSPDLDRETEAEQICTDHHLYHDRLTVNAVIYGPLVYTKNGQEFDWIYQLYQLGEAATVSWSNLQDIDRIAWRDCGSGPPRLISCENEAPYSQLIRRRRGDCLLFSNGFPGSAVRRLYGLLAPRAASCLHWGDTDPNGLHIAALLHEIHPLTLYRCDLETVRRHTEYLRPLSPRQQQRAAFILINNHRFPFREELAYSLENGWLEQENWRES